ncbi:MAG: glycosyltransferase [Bacteriovoracia bacterium]
MRNLSLVRAFADAGWEQWAVSGAKESEHSAALAGLGIPVRQIEPNDPAFDALVGEVQPDLVLFDRFVTEEQFGWRVREAAPAALRVIDTQDLHFLRRSREASLRRPGLAGVHGLSKEWRESPDFLRELAAIYRSDGALILSDFELNLLQTEVGVPGDLLHHSPMSIVREPLAELPRWESRRDFVMIGNFRHAPNWDGVQWLAAEIWPRMRARLSEAELHLYGAYPPKEAGALEKGKGIRMMGWATDAHETLRRYRVNLAALRFGAGIKGKVLTGWGAGTPAVATSVGAEGLGGELPFGGRVADSADAFAREAAELYESAEAWASAQRAGERILVTRFDPDQTTRTLLARLEDWRTRREERRARNPIGAILWREQYQSTRYLSKWIEEKNRRSVVEPPCAP